MVVENILQQCLTLGMFIATLLLPAIVLWLASGRNLVDFIKFGRALASSGRQREDVSQIDPEILASCIQDLRMGDDLSVAYRQMDHIPLCIVHSRGADTITKVDLTECGICDLSNLSYFTALELLVLDKNKLEVGAEGGGEDSPATPRTKRSTQKKNSLLTNPPPLPRPPSRRTFPRAPSCPACTRCGATTTA